jgi:hypothetical protein
VNWLVKACVWRSELAQSSGLKTLALTKTARFSETLPTSPHGDLTQKKDIRIVTEVKTVDLTNIKLYLKGKK